MVENESVIDTLFNHFVEKVAQKSNEESLFQEQSKDACTHNGEHLVFCAKSLRLGVDLCFICTAFNFATIKKHQAQHHFVMARAAQFPCDAALC
jgi:hypothetical protein